MSRRRSNAQLAIEKESAKIRLAQGMHFAPDLQVGSVILKAMIVPSFQEPGLLAATMATKIALGGRGRLQKR